MIYNASENKKEAVKAGVTPHTLQELKGKDIKVTNIVVSSKTNEDTGEIVNVCSVKVGNEYYSSISKSVFDSVQTIINFFEPAEIVSGIDLVVDSGKSKNNREFLYLNIK